MLEPVLDLREQVAELTVAFFSPKACDLVRFKEEIDE
jgi:hypothetical protein